MKTTHSKYLIHGHLPNLSRAAPEACRTAYTSSIGDETRMSSVHLIYLPAKHLVTRQAIGRLLGDEYISVAATISTEKAVSGQV
jgi:hypothetical protein